MASTERAVESFCLYGQADSHVDENAFNCDDYRRVQAQWGMSAAMRWDATSMESAAPVPADTADVDAKRQRRLIVLRRATPRASQ